MEERRKLERFELKAPARILIESTGRRPDEYRLTTRDISSGGAFLCSEKPLPEGSRVRMELIISFDALQKLAGEKGRARIRVKGRVIRSDSSGIAVKFENGFKISALENNSSLSTSG